MFETNTAAVSQRAEALLTRVRGVQPGIHLTEWQTMIHTICGARDCLLNPTTKAAYDARLRAEMPARIVPTQLDRRAAERRSSIRRWWARAKPTVMPAIVVAFSATVVAVAAAFYYQACRQEAANNESENSPRSEPVAQHAALAVADSGIHAVTGQPRGEAKDAEKPSAHEAAQPVLRATPPSKNPLSTTQRLPDRSLVALAAAEVKQREEEAAADAPAGEKKADGDKNGSAQVDAQKQENYKRTVVAARTAMSRRDVVGAKRQAKAAVALAQTPEEEAEAARLQSLAQHLGEFWKLLNQVVAGLTPAQEFTLNNTPVVVVEVSPTQVAFRMDGRNRSFLIKELPREIVVAMAQGGFVDNAASKLLLGTFHAMDATGDRKEARRLWQELIDAGNDVSDLMAELRVAPIGKSSSPQMPPQTPTQTPATTPKATGAKIDAPTDATALRQAEQAVRAQFEVDYNLASSVNGKLKLSEKLAGAAAGTEVPAANRYIMLRDARDYALAAGKPGVACDVIDQMAQHFNVDVIEQKTDTIERAVKAVRTSSGSKETAEAALTLTDQAMQLGRWSEASRLAAAAVSAAQRVRNAALLHSAREAKLKAEEGAEKAGNGEKKVKR